MPSSHWVGVALLGAGCADVLVAVLLRPRVPAAKRGLLMLALGMSSVTMIGLGAALLLGVIG